MQDLKHACRQLLKAPGFTLIAIATLALGIGACTAVYSLVDGIMIRSLPYPEPERLYMLFESSKGQSAQQSFGNLSSASYLHWREQASSFSSLAAWHSCSYNVTGEGQPFRVYAQQLTVNLFPLLGLRPALGRGFLPDEGDPAHARAVILSHRTWQDRFSGRADILGRTLMLDEKSYTIVGVMQENSRFEPSAAIFTPMVFTAGSARDFQQRHLVAGRLRTGVTADQAATETKVIGERLARELPEHYQGLTTSLIPMRTAYAFGASRILSLLLGATTCLLLVGCANIASLQLVRATSRRREIALRTALGASRSRIIRQLLAESLLLAILGGGAGWLIGRWGLDGILAFLPQDVIQSYNFVMDGPVFAFTGGLTLLTVVLSGLVPAWRASRVDLNACLKEGGERGTAWSTQRLRSVFVVSEIALALMLLTGAGLFFRSLQKARDSELGFETATTYMNVLLLPAQKYPSSEQRVLTVDRLCAEISRVPGVTAVAFTNHTTPASGMRTRTFTIAGRPLPDPGQQPRGFHYGVTPDYFEVFGIPLLRGRLLTTRDTANAPRVVLINRELARRHFPDEDPIGKQIATIDGGAVAPREIVGIVADVRQGSLLDTVQPQIYEPYAQVPGDSTSFIVRTTGQALDAKGVIAAVHAVDPTMPLEEMYPMAEGLDHSIAPYRTVVALFGIFSFSALLLAALGIYSVMAYTVAQRTGEIGIRMALGAQRRDVFKLIAWQNGRLLAIGLIIGLGGSLAVTRLLGSLLYETSPHDPVTIVTTMGIFAAVAMLASWLPARRATRIDPLEALRSQ